MEILISKRNFLKGLVRSHPITDRKSSVPILSNVLLTADGNGLRLAATDLYLGVNTVVPCEVKRPGTVAVSGKTLFEIVKSLPDGELQWTVGPNHNAEIRSGKVRFRIPGLSGEDFPPLPTPGDAAFSSIDVDLLSDLLNKTSYSMSNDDSRPHLSGTLLQGEGKLARAVTTDGHRLSKCESRLRQDASPLNFTMLVPQKGIGELRRILDDAKSERPKDANDDLTIELAMAGGNAYFRREGLTLSVKLATEQFPPYQKVIPASATKSLLVHRTSLTEALRRISLVSQDRSGGVRFSLDKGVLRIIGESKELGEGSEEIDVPYDGGALSIGFNARYWLEVLTAMTDDEVLLEFSGDLDPGVIKSSADANHFVGVIMPMRI